MFLDKGKIIDKEWDNNNLNFYINDCINIENNIKLINIISESIKKCNEKNIIKFKFISNFDDFKKNIKLFGKLYNNKYSLKDCPINIDKGRKYILKGESNNILIKTGLNGYWMGTICAKELDNSIEIHKWKIKILKTDCRAIMVGVTNSDFDINSSNYNSGFFFNFYNSSLYSGAPHNYDGKKTNLTNTKDEVIVIFNIKKGTLKFIINDEDKGDSYTNIPVDKPLYPAVLLCYQGDSVEITDIN